MEVASWKLATDLVRRHPELTVERYHPAGGTYDCLAIRSSNGLHIDLNRRGRIHVHAIEGGVGHPNWEPAEWTSYLGADPRDFVSHLEQVVRLGPVAQLPPSTPKILVYRLLTAVARLQVLAETAEISMSTIDSSGYGAGPASWLAGYPAIRRSVEAGDEFGFWHANAPGIEFAVEVTTGTVLYRDGSQLGLADIYARTEHSFTKLLGVVLGI
ncbi:hypothetical protein [Nocardioides sp. NPDC127503]|uniref:TY-Chap2 family putative peptide chaperone n=1 Tax=Nocardioides sp. NPDC127503 TaxID=3154516 RepID=UPI0033305E3F